jgi:endonuclease YncB( thermonuclease family)
VLETTHKDLYGRYIGLLHLGDTTINQQLLEAGLAVPFKA